MLESNKTGLEGVKYKDRIRLGGVKYKNKIGGPWPTTTIYVQGCYKSCENCFNESLQELSGGKELTVEELAADLIENTPNKKVSFCGGEPMLWAGQLAKIADILHEHDFTVLSYTGYKYEDLMGDNLADYFEEARKLIESVDILVDGEFQKENKLEIGNFKFVGSSNQRVIDINKSLEQGEIVEYDY
jgi:anaerobic ribonucleoside-triphosphate reductase activating protein